MNIGTVKEIKDNETRVGLTCHGVKVLTAKKHIVYIESGAGLGSGLSDDDYRSAGASICDTAAEVWRKAELIVKVKELLPSEYAYLRENQTIFTFFHLAEGPSYEMTANLLNAQVRAISLEMIKLTDGTRPAVVPMSEIAGQLAALFAARMLMKDQGGPGIMPGCVPGVMPADVLVLGGGNVGRAAARTLNSIGADVKILEINPVVVNALSNNLPHCIKVLFYNSETLAERLKTCSIFVCAIYPKPDQETLVTREAVRSMQPGSIIVDVGGSSVIETSRYTTISNPVYIEEGVLHYCVDNTPALVPRTSTPALTNITFPYVEEIADRGVVKCLQENPIMRNALVTFGGHLVNWEVAVAQKMESKYIDVNEVLSA